MRRAASQMTMAGGIGIAGDLAMQVLEGAEQPSELSAARSARLAAFRIVQAPILDVAWQQFDRRIVLRSAARTVAAKVAADQLLLMPPFAAAFFFVQGKLEGLSTDECVDRVRRAFVPTVRAALPFWGCAHVVTFAVVPSAYRVAWTSLASIGWNAFMSHTNQRASGSDGGEDESQASREQRPPHQPPPESPAPSHQPGSSPRRPHDEAEEHDDGELAKPS